MAIDEDVVTLEISVQLPTTVYGIQSTQYLPEYIGDDWFRNGPSELGDEVVECPIVHVLDEHEERVLHIGGRT